MHAVIVTGGQQHRVEKDQVLRVQKLTSETGKEIEFDQVLVVSDGKNCQVGKPYVAGAKVKATVLSHERGDKVEIIKFRRRKHSQTKQGHRQWHTFVKITEIESKA